MQGLKNFEGKSCTQRRFRIHTLMEVMKSAVTEKIDCESCDESFLISILGTFAVSRFYCNGQIKRFSNRKFPRRLNVFD